MKKTSIVLGIGATLICFHAFLGNSVLERKAALGEKLFFEPLLSRTKTISCASCHRPEFAFADTARVSVGVEGRKGTRNSPTAMNVLLRSSFFWDGRARTLEEQALAPITNPVEMDLHLDSAVRRLRESAKYRSLFDEVFHEEPTKENLAIAIAAFERTLETSDSPFDNWKYSGDPLAVSEAVKRGLLVFNGKGKCNRCHFGADFTQNEFRNIGLFNGRNLNDSGRIMITGKPEDLGRFKTASLRNVAVTAPYMHNGMFRTLEQVIEFYDDPGKMVRHAINRDTVLAQPLRLNEREKKDLKAFLVSLTDRRFTRTARQK